MTKALCNKTSFRINSITRNSILRMFRAKVKFSKDNVKSIPLLLLVFFLFSTSSKEVFSLLKTYLLPKL